MVLGSRYHSVGRKAVSDSSAIAGALRDVELVFKEADARKEERFRRGIRPDMVSFIEHGPLRVILSATPTNETLPSYVNVLHQYNVSHVVRVSESNSYDANELKRQGFSHDDWTFKDGESPPDKVITNWLQLLDNVFELHKHSNRYTSAYTPPTSESDDLESNGSSSSTTINNMHSLNSSPNSSTDSQQQQKTKKCIAIHCAAGLGRAPVLVAIALVELGLSPSEAIGWLRAMRRGAINGHQLAFLQQYVPRSQLVTAKKHRLCSRRSRSPFTFWRKGFSNSGSKRTKSPPSPNSTARQNVSSNNWNVRNASPMGRNALQSLEDARRGSHERAVVWADEKRSSQSTSSNGRNSPHSHQTLKAMRKAQVKDSRYLSM